MAAGIEDIYALSPAQQGMLLTTQAAPALYSETFTCVLEGALDASRFRAAWNKTAARNTVLRTSFHWDGLPSPVQVVHRDARVPWNDSGHLDVDWRGHRRSEFNVNKAPLSEWTLVRLDAGRARLIWNYHHLILDGWSVFLLLNATLREYAGLPVPPAPPYRSFIEWVQRQDLAAAKAFWQTELQGYEPRAVFQAARQQVSEASDIRHVLPVAQTTALKEVARKYRVSLSTVFQAAWAVVLGRWSGSDDIAFGLTVSGRPEDLPHADEIAGMFINTVPLRVSIADCDLGNLLGLLQKRATALQKWSFIPPAEIRDWNGVARTAPLFDTALVYQNYPLTAGIRFDGITVGEFDGSGGRTHYVFTLLIAPGEACEIRLIPGLGRSPNTGAVMNDYRQALDAIAAERFPDFEVLPRTHIESVAPAAQGHPVARIWAEVLGSGNARPGADLFECGGDSLSAVKLAAAITAEFGIEISPFDLLRDRVTIESLAAKINQFAAPAVPIQRRPGVAEAPLSYSQQPLWAFYRMSPDSVAYNGTISVHITGGLCLGALERALGALVERQHSLRTVFFESEGVPRQRVIPSAFSLDLADFDAPHSEAATTYRRGFATRSFQLESAPCFRAVLMRFGPNRSELLISMHHIVCDGWSVSVFLRELAALYNSSPMPEFPIQYLDYAAWQRGLDSDRWAVDSAYWKKKLASPPRLCRQVSVRDAGRLEFALDSERSRLMKERCRACGVTLFSGLLACYQASFGTVFDVFDVVTGTPFAERERPECRDLIGLMLNTLVMRTDLAGDPTIAELFARVRVTVDEAYAHRALPFARLAGTGAGLPFEFWFVLDNTPEAKLDLDGVHCTVSELPAAEARFPMALLLRPVRNVLEGYLEYNPAAVCHEAAAAVLRRFTGIVDIAAHNPSQKLSGVRTMAAAQSEFAF